MTETGRSLDPKLIGPQPARMDPKSAEDARLWRGGFHEITPDIGNYDLSSHIFQPTESTPGKLEGLSPLENFGLREYGLR